MDVAPPETNVIKVELLDFPITPEKRKHTIKVDVSSLQHLAPGRHQVTLSIKSDHEAKLLVDGREK